MTPRELAIGIVDGYADYYARNSNRAGGLQVTQAAWSTDTDEVSAAIDALAMSYEDASADDAGNYKSTPCDPKARPDRSGRDTRPPKNLSIPSTCNPARAICEEHGVFDKPRDL